MKMNLKKLKKKTLSELSVSEMKEIVKSKTRIEDAKHSLHKKLFNKLSVYQTIFFLRLGFSADMLSGLWIALGIISTLFLWAGNYWMNIAYFIALFIVSFMDHSDGEIARYWKWRKGETKGTLKGLYFESISHFLIRVFIFFGIGVGAWVRFNQIYYFYAGIALTMLLLFDQVIKLREYHVLIQAGKLELLKESKESKLESGKKLGWLYTLFKPEFMEKSLFFWALIFNVLHWFLIVTLVLFTFLFFKNLYTELKILENFDKQVVKK